MEDIIKFHQANVPFLIFPHIKSLICSSIKSFVTKQQKIDTFKVKITGLQTPDAFNHLPKHLQVQFNKLIKADLSPEILKVGHDFLFQKERTERTAAAGSAGDARPHLRQVRPGPFHAPRPDPARHRRRARQASGPGAAVSIRAGGDGN